MVNFLADCGTDDEEALINEQIQLGLLIDRGLRGDSRTQLVLDANDHSGLA